MNKKGFTLLELMIVIIIVGILASLAVPRYRRVIETGKQTEALNNLGMIRQALLRYAQMRGQYTTTWGNLDIEQPSTAQGTARYFTYTLQTTGSYNIASANLGIVRASRNNSENPNYGSYTLTIQQGGNVTKTTNAP